MDTSVKRNSFEDMNSDDSADEEKEVQEEELPELPEKEALFLKAMRLSMKTLLKSELRNELKGVKQSVTNLKVAVESSSTTNNQRFDKIESENVVLRSKVSQLQRENESLQVELREKNLILCGINDSENESEAQLYKTICELFKKITICVSSDIIIRPDKVYRINKFSPDRIRNVKVKFVTLSDRDTIFRNRDKIRPPITFKPDIPFTIRRDHAILMRKQTELQQEGERCTVDMKSRQLTYNGRIFNVIDGKLNEEAASEEPIAKGTSNPPPAKRARTGRKKTDYFLGQDAQPSIAKPSTSTNPPAATNQTFKGIGNQ
ncbi:unnamed protein product [Orchesella dallaii]|uniref:Uncharacterized protein n=1 Tax=Orchesella dallaii TaxID=48710 RepID=A0ABP1RUG2_9HEXA